MAVAAEQHPRAELVVGVHDLAEFDDGLAAGHGVGGHRRRRQPLIPAQLCGRISRTLAAWINRVRRYLLPRLEMRPRIDRPPVLCCRGTKPSQAPKSRPDSKASPVPIAATMPVEITGPTPRNTHQPLAFGLSPAEGFDLAGDVSMRASRPHQSS